MIQGLNLATQPDHFVDPFRPAMDHPNTSGDDRVGSGDEKEG
jgi:hypothetical protein